MAQEKQKLSFLAAQDAPSGIFLCATRFNLSGSSYLLGFTCDSFRVYDCTSLDEISLLDVIPIRGGVKQAVFNIQDSPQGPYLLSFLLTHAYQALFLAIAPSTAVANVETGVLAADGRLKVIVADSMAYGESTIESIMQAPFLHFSEESKVLVLGLHEKRLDTVNVKLTWNFSKGSDGLPKFISMQSYSTSDPVLDATVVKGKLIALLRNPQSPLALIELPNNSDGNPSTAKRINDWKPSFVSFGGQLPRFSWKCSSFDTDKSLQAVGVTHPEFITAFKMLSSGDNILILARSMGLILDSSLSNVTTVKMPTTPLAAFPSIDGFNIQFSDGIIRNYCFGSSGMRHVTALPPCDFFMSWDSDTLFFTERLGPSGFVPLEGAEQPDLDALYRTSIRLPDTQALGPIHAAVKIDDQVYVAAGTEFAGALHLLRHTAQPNFRSSAIGELSGITQMAGSSTSLVGLGPHKCFFYTDTLKIFDRPRLQGFIVSLMALDGGIGLLYGDGTLAANYGSDWDFSRLSGSARCACFWNGVVYLVTGEGAIIRVQGQETLVLGQTSSASLIAANGRQVAVYSGTTVTIYPEMREVSTDSTMVTDMVFLSDSLYVASSDGYVQVIPPIGDTEEISVVDSGHVSLIPLDSRLLVHSAFIDEMDGSIDYQTAIFYTDRMTASVVSGSAAVYAGAFDSVFCIKHDTLFKLTLTERGDQLTPMISEAVNGIPNNMVVFRHYIVDSLIVFTAQDVETNPCMGMLTGETACQGSFIEVRDQELLMRAGTFIANEMIVSLCTVPYGPITENQDRILIAVGTTTFPEIHSVGSGNLYLYALTEEGLILVYKHEYQRPVSALCSAIIPVTTNSAIRAGLLLVGSGRTVQLMTIDQNEDGDVVLTELAHADSFSYITSIESHHIGKKNVIFIGDALKSIQTFFIQSNNADELLLGSFYADYEEDFLNRRLQPITVADEVEFHASDPSVSIRFLSQDFNCLSVLTTAILPLGYVLVATEDAQLVLLHADESRLPESNDPPQPFTVFSYQLSSPITALIPVIPRLQSGAVAATPAFFAFTRAGQIIRVVATTGGLFNAVATMIEHCNSVLSRKAIVGPEHPLLSLRSPLHQCNLRYAQMIQCNHAITEGLFFCDAFLNHTFTEADYKEMVTKMGMITVVPENFPLMLNVLRDSFNQMII